MSKILYYIAIYAIPCFFTYYLISNNYYLWKIQFYLGQINSNLDKIEKYNTAQVILLNKINKHLTGEGVLEKYGYKEIKDSIQENLDNSKDKENKNE